MSFRLKVHKYDKERLIAICDDDLCGVILTLKGVKLKINEKFYGRDSLSSDEILSEIASCTSLNAIGKEICELLIKHKIVHPATVLWIDYMGDKVGHVILVI